MVKDIVFMSSIGNISLVRVLPVPVNQMHLVRVVLDLTIASAIATTRIDFQVILFYSENFINSLAVTVISTL